MKKYSAFLFAVPLLVCSLLFFGVRSADAKNNNNLQDSFGQHAIYTTETEVFYVKNGSSPIKLSLTDTGGFGGVSAFENAAYIATIETSPGIYKFTYSTGALEKILSWSEVGTLEANYTPEYVKIFSEDWVWYQLVALASTDEITYNSRYEKLYNLKEKKSYGSDELIKTSFTGEDTQKQYEEALRKQFSFALLTPGETLGVGDDLINRFSSAPLNQKQVSILGYGGTGLAEKSYIEARLLDLDTMKIRKVGKKMGENEYILLQSSKTASKYSIGVRPTSMYETYYYRMDVDSMTKAREIIHKTDLNVNVLAVNGAEMVWLTGSKAHYYNAQTDQFCETDSKNIIYKSYGSVSNGYLFNLTDGDTRKPYFTYVGCGQASLPPPLIVPISSPVDLTDGSLIKSTTQPAVYYLAKDGKRYVFSDREVFGSWYKDFSGMKTITPEAMANITIGGNVTYRPGTRMVKISSDPRVYAVDAHGTLRWIANETVARGLYGTSWAKEIRVIPDFLFINYTVGAPIATVSDFSPTAAIRAATSINVDKSL